MHNRGIVLALLAMSTVGLTGCDDDTVAGSPQDAGMDHSVVTFDGPTPFEAATFVDSAAPGEGGAGEAAAPPPRLLLSFNGSTTSELVAFGVESKAVDGRLTFDDFIGGAYVGATAPWLLEEGNDLVARLDGQKPWTIDSSWNVALNDLTDAGYTAAYSDPVAVVAGSGTKAYVFRYTRNLVAVIDTSQTADAGQPAGTIDLSGEVQAGGDGYVQPVAAVYVASQHLIYAVLANINRNLIDLTTYDLLCSTSTPTIIAIDTTSDTLVDLNGAAAGHGWPLLGYSPAFSPGALAYDPLTGTDGRLLVLEGGCHPQTGDGGVGALTKSEIDAVDLKTGQTTELLDLTSASFVQSLTYIDAHHAIVQLDTAYAWDPTTSTLGAAIPNAPDAFAYDGQGNLLGISAQYGADGGMSGYAVLSVNVADGGVTTLGSNPFTLTKGFLGGATLWPRP